VNNELRKWREKLVVASVSVLIPAFAYEDWGKI
jgi:hypothetical protein